MFMGTGEEKEGGSFVGGAGGDSTASTKAKKRGSSIFGGVTTLRGPLEKWLGDELLVSDAQSLVAGPVLRPTGETGLRDMGYIGLYFGGAWSPPCRSFVPKLEKACAEINSRGKVFEVVYAGTDMEKADLVETLKDRTWCAMKPGRGKELQKLIDHLGVDTVPCLVVCRVTSKALKIVTMNGVSCMLCDPAARLFPWTKEPKRRA